MTDKEKLDAIRAEIHRLVNVRGYDREMANDLIAFMNSLPNEPVSNDLEEASKKYSSCIYLEEVLSDDDREVLKERLINTFKAGAQWQAFHSLDTIKGMEEQAFLAGVEAEQINQNYGKDLLYVCNQTSERTKKKFIDKSDIVAEIERLIKSYSPIWSSEGKYRVEAYKEVLDIIKKMNKL